MKNSKGAPMDALTIIPVRTKKERKEFVEYPLQLYKGNPYFVPSLYGDEMKIFTSKNIYNATCDSVFYLAKRDGKTVGRIQGIIQKQYNEIHNTKQARFTRFDSENNEETSRALLNAAENWSKAKGMEYIVGPLGYSDLEREGLLIEGFNYLCTYEEQYNYEYYPQLIEACGYVKDVDWVEYRLFSTKKQDERLERLISRACEKHNLHFVDQKMNKAKFLKKYAPGIFHCIDECYKDLYGVVPFTPEMVKELVKQFSLVLNMEYIIAVCDANEEVVAFGFCLPAIGEALQKSGGKLTPACIVKLLSAIRKPKSIDLALVGIMPQYRKSGLSAFMMLALERMLAKENVEYLETNLNLETNANIQANWKNFESIQHKRRRSYIKTL